MDGSAAAATRPSRRGRALLFRLLASAAVAALGALPVQAQPAGGTVVFGAAGISAAGGTTTVTQSSARAVINWQDFSVGAGQTVRFSQPDASSITLNRVMGSAPSAIDGTISANGQVWLLNRNGILVGQGANIDVGGLLASTSAITDQDFADGRYRFSGGGNAVANHGTIRARKGGSVVLSAPSVANTGLVEAEAGHVVMGGTQAFTVDFAGDHLLSYAVDGTKAGSVSNSGILRAAGGRITMTARAAAGIEAGVLNNSGVVEAVSVRSENGEIVLDAGEGGASNSGTLNASGRRDGETGGSVTLLGRTIDIADGAVLDVSGDAGAGRIDIGGKGGPAAQETRIGKARMAADAIRGGNGGAVTIWSGGHTDFAGSISARGGARGGNGGQVETSGYTLRVDPAASVDTLAPLGSAGTWLLDPHNIIIQTAGGALANTTFASTPAADNTIATASIVAALATGNVTLQANNDILINNAFTMGGSTTNTLTLQAGRSISLANGQILSYPTGNIVLSANDPGAILANRDAGPAFITTGSTGGFLARRLDLILNSDGLDGSSIGTAATPFFDRGSATYIKTNGASAFATTFNLGNSGHVLGADMGAGSLTLTTTGVQQTAPLSLRNLTILLPAGASSNGQVSLTNAANAITGTVNATVMSSNTAGGFSIVNGQSLTVGTINVVPTPAGSPTRGVASARAATGNVTLTGNIDASLISLIADNGDINQTGGVIFAHAPAGGTGRINSRSFGDTNLLSAGNFVEGTIFATGNGAETMLNPGVLTIFSGGATTINAASSVMLTGSTSSAGISTAGGGMTITVTGTTALTSAAGAAISVYNGIGINSPISVPASIPAGLAPTSPAIPVTTGGPITLHAAGDVRQLTGIRTEITTAGGLNVVSDHGSIDLRASFMTVDGSGNPVEIGSAVQGVISLVAGEGSAVLLQPAQIRLGTSSAAGQLSVLQCVSAATCALHPPQNLIIEPGATLTSLLAAGDGVVLGTQRNFINNSGSTAIRVPNGARWLVYSGTPAGNVFNGLDSGNTAIWGIQSLGIGAPGNRYAFLFQPTLTVTADTVSKPVGLDYSASLGGYYSVTGLQAGVAGAFLGDTAAIFSGAPLLGSSGAAADAAVGSYALTIAPGSFAAANGYAVVFQNGVLTVIPSAVAIIEPLTSFTVASTAPAATLAATADAPSIVATVVESPVVVSLSAIAVTAPVAPTAQPVVAPAAPLAELASSDDGTTAETPVSSDSATSEIATLEPAGTAAAASSSSSGSGSSTAVNVIIPGMLTAAPALPPQPAPMAGTLSAWGNAALWQ